MNAGDLHYSPAEALRAVWDHGGGGESRPGVPDRPGDTLEKRVITSYP